MVPKIISHFEGTKWIDEWIDGQIDKWIDGQMDKLINGQMNRCKDRQINKWIDGQNQIDTDRWIDRFIYRLKVFALSPS